MLFAPSRASDGSYWEFANVASLLTRTGVAQLSPPSEDFVKKMSVCETVPPQPAKARSTTPSDPTAMEGLPAVYAGTRSTCTFGPKYGGMGAAEAAGVMNTN